MTLDVNFGPLHSCCVRDAKADFDYRKDIHILAFNHIRLIYIHIIYYSSILSIYV